MLWSSPLPFRFGIAAFPLRNNAEVYCALAGLHFYNVEYFTRFPSTPGLYSTKTKYVREYDMDSRAELKWRVVPIILQTGESDCKGLATYRSAEICVKEKPLIAEPIVIELPDVLHIIVKILYPDGRERFEDPSLKLGMPAPAGYPVELLR